MIIDFVIFVIILAGVAVESVSVSTIRTASLLTAVLAATGTGVVVKVRQGYGEAERKGYCEEEAERPLRARGSLAGVTMVKQEKHGSGDHNEASMGQWMDYQCKRLAR